MKKSYSKSLTFALALSMGIILLVLQSCKSLDPSTLHHTTQHCTTLHNSVDTVVIYDSVFIRELKKGDTIFCDRIEYRDRWRTRIVHDTILKTDSIVQVIEHPPEKYIPPFYKRCTTILFIILAAGVVWIVGSFNLKL